MSAGVLCLLPSLLLTCFFGGKLIREGEKKMFHINPVLFHKRERERGGVRCTFKILINLTRFLCPLELFKKVDNCMKSLSLLPFEKIISLRFSPSPMKEKAESQCQGIANKIDKYHDYRFFFEKLTKYLRTAIFIESILKTKPLKFVKAQDISKYEISPTFRMWSALQNSEKL